LLISLSVIAIADAFLHKGNVWAHDQRSMRPNVTPLYDAIHEKSRLHKRATHASAQTSPKPNVYIEHHYASLCIDVEY